MQTILTALTVGPRNSFATLAQLPGTPADGEEVGGHGPLFPEAELQRSALRGLASRRLIFMMYNLYMSELAMSEARNRLAEAIDTAINGEPVYVTRRGRRVAVLVDAASYDALVEAAEDAFDRAELVAARVEDDYVPWEEVKADLGLR
jgi:prevent-host-death family protein